MSIGLIIKAVFYQPIFNLLIAIYNFVPGHDMGLAIVVMTLCIKALTLPLSASMIRGQKRMQELQPKLKELQTKFKDDKEGLAKETMALYAAEKVNPLASCLPLLIQMPFLIALYAAMGNGLNSAGLDILYSFVHNPGSIVAVTLGGILLTTPSKILAIIAGAAQYWQVAMLARARPPQPTPDGGKDEDLMAMMNKQMLYITPLMTLIITWKLPAGLALYWIVSNLFAVAQQYWVFAQTKKATV